jgi:septal ring factor EnvC (AmiA/AmiB activator)
MPAGLFRISAALCFVLCLAAARAGADESEQQSLKDRIGSQQEELDRIKSEIEKRRAESKKLRRQERSVVQKLSVLDREIDLSRQFLANLEQQESLMSEQVDSLRARIEVEDGALTAHKSVYARRLRQMYKRDPNYRWDIVLGSENIQEALRRYKFTSIVAERDAALITEMRWRKLVYETESASLTESLADMAVVRNERQDETRRMEQGKRRRQTMLASIRSQKTEHANAIEELEQAQKQVKNLIGDLEKRRLASDGSTYVPDGEFGELKGQMIRPVEGKIVRGFGTHKHPKYGTVTFNNGVDIGSTAGAPIRAVASGQVEFVDWIDGYGKCIILNHGGGYYTLYAHVSATFISQGQKIAGGDVIAEVGDTGSLNGFECHFEIRKSKQALNPAEWFAR